MPRVTHAVRARIVARRAEGAAGQAATPRWKRFAPATALVLIAALVATILLIMGLGPQPTSATEPCANGTVVPSPADNPGLVADCAALLAARDTLRGTATLNWSAQRAISSWSGVTVAPVRYGGPKRVTGLNLDSRSLDGAIPASLGGLSALRTLRLGFNRLTGSIPPELGLLTQLQTLLLNENRLSGTIPPELADIGATLTSLQLAGPNPLPAGVGLSGTIPPQLGNLSGLQYLNLSHNRLSGPIPPRLGRLVNISWLSLNRNLLSGSIPTQLGNLTQLANVRLDDNQLSGVIPSQLGRLTRLTKVYMVRNAAFSGCLPPRLREVRNNDMARLNLPDCAYGAAATPATPEPTHTLTATAAEGGNVEPAGMTTQVEGEPVTLTASWNDATHTFAGWGSACSGTATTCILELYSDQTVTASFTALPADRCATTTDASCIRAVYKGAPEDYAQVQDIPDSLLIQPDGDGRYHVERGQQITVVTAAPLPADYTRFYLQRAPLERPSPISYARLIPPVGTTYTFTPTEFEGAASRISFNLTAARPRPLPRPGQKPELGDVIVATTFSVTNRPPNTVSVAPTMLKATFAPGTHKFDFGDASRPYLVIDVPTSKHQIKWLEALNAHPGGLTICLSDIAEETILCIRYRDAASEYFIPPSATTPSTDVSIRDVLDYIASSARVEVDAP